MRRNFTKFVMMVGLTLAMAGCKLTSNGNGFPTPPPSSSSEYLFVSANGSIWSYKVDATTGALSSSTSVTGPSQSLGIAVDPAGKFLYVSDSDNDEIDVYSISSTGVLTATSGSPFTVGTPVPSTANATGIAFDSTGQFLYVTDLANNQVVTFSVNSSTGALTSVGTPVFAASGPVQVIVDASNKYVYVSNYTHFAGGISAYSRDSTTGVLTPVPGSSPFTTVASGGPVGLTTHGSFLYTGELNAGKVAGLSIDSTTGGLSTILGSPFTAGNGTTGVAIDSAGKFLYAANADDHTISIYSVDGTGALTAAIPATAAAGDAPQLMAIDPSGKFLYVDNINDGTISGYTINPSTGALSPYSAVAATALDKPGNLVVATISN